MAFKIGQKVVCIQGQSHNTKTIGGWAPKTNLIYTIRGIVRWKDVKFLHLEEYVHPEMFMGLFEYGWEAHRFRPLVTEKDDVERFRHLLSPSPLERLDLLAERLNELATD